MRSGVKPDFQPPLGELGKIGLAKGTAHAVLPAQALAIAPHSVASKSTGLAFGDATFQPSTAADREGGVRDGKRPDFQPPLGNLGETGLAGGSKAAALVEQKAPEEAHVDKKENGIQVGCVSVSCMFFYFVSCAWARKCLHASFFCMYMCGCTCARVMCIPAHK